MNPPAKFLPNGDTVMVVEFGEEIDLDISRRVTALYAGVNALELAGITDLVPTFRSLAIHYDPERSAERRVGTECRSRWSPYP